MVMHKEANCLELPENEDKSKKGWKSIFNRMKNPHYKNWLRLGPISLGEEDGINVTNTKYLCSTYR